MLKELFKKWFFWDIFDDSDIVKPIHKVKEVVPQVEEVVITERLVKVEPMSVKEEPKIEVKTEEKPLRKKKTKVEKKLPKKTEKKIDKKKTKKKKR